MPMRKTRANIMIFKWLICIKCKPYTNVNIFNKCNRCMKRGSRTPDHVNIFNKYDCCCIRYGSWTSYELWLPEKHVHKFHCFNLADAIVERMWTTWPIVAIGTHWLNIPLTASLHLGNFLQGNGQAAQKSLVVVVQRWCDLHSEGKNIFTPS